MLFKTFSSLLCPPPPPPSSTLTADNFGTFYINKIANLTAQFSTPQSVKHILPANINSFTYFSPLSEAEISKLILSSHPTTCPLDPIPSHLLQAISPAVVPALTHIVNTSLHTGMFPSVFKHFSFCLHGFTRFCHSETWLFISLLCWWHSTLPLIPSWWSDDSCSHLSMSSRHFLLDEGPSPSTQPS